MGDPVDHRCFTTVGAYQLGVRPFFEIRPKASENFGEREDVSREQRFPSALPCDIDAE